MFVFLFLKCVELLDSDFFLLQLFPLSMQEEMGKEKKINKYFFFVPLLDMMTSARLSCHYVAFL